MESLFPIDNEIKNPKEIGSIKLFKMEKRYKKNPVYVEEKEQDGLGD